MNMYHLGSQQNTDGTLRLVGLNQVYLHKCRRITRDTAVTWGEQQQRRAWLPESGWRKSCREGCHEFIVKDSQTLVKGCSQPKAFPKESIPNLTSLPAAGASIGQTRR